MWPLKSKQDKKKSTSNYGRYGDPRIESSDSTADFVATIASSFDSGSSSVSCDTSSSVSCDSGSSSSC